jgi:hypothetical protein
MRHDDTTVTPRAVGGGRQRRLCTVDAAYMLGSLSSADRREFETHLSSCASCRESVSELSGMPTLLAQLDRDDGAAINDGRSGSPPPLNPQMLISLRAKVGRWRRLSRAMTGSVAVAAAAFLVIGVLVAGGPHPVATVPPRQITASALTMNPVPPTPVVAIGTTGRRFPGWLGKPSSCTEGNVDNRSQTWQPQPDDPG